MSVDWYHRAGIDPWQMGACDLHGAELVALGFQRGLSPLRNYDDDVGAAQQCALCNGSTSIDQVRACRCNNLGLPCPVHRPAPAGAAGEWTHVRCSKCGAGLQLPADRIAFERSSVLPAFSDQLVAVDITGWARRNGDGDELWCPFHGAARYPLEYVSGPMGELEDDELLDDEPLDDEVYRGPGPPLDDDDDGEVGNVPIDQSIGAPPRRARGPRTTPAG